VKMDIAEIVKDSLRLWAAYELVKTLSPEDQVALYNKMFPSQQLPQTSRDIFHHIFQAGPIAIPSLTVLPAPKPSPDPEILEAGNWLKRIKHPSVVLSWASVAVANPRLGIGYLSICAGRQKSMSSAYLKRPGPCCQIGSAWLPA